MKWIFALIIMSLGWGLAQSTTNEPTAQTCNPNFNPRPEPRTEAERLERERWAAYREKLTGYLELLPKQAEATILNPVRGTRVRQIADTFGAPREGYRQHEGQDIFAPRGTPIYSATNGIVWRIGSGARGGLYVFVAGAGNRRYYYAHLGRYNPNLKEGQKVTTTTILGYVGNTGNARTTPPHLHFGVYSGSRRTCDYKIINPLSLLRDRDWRTVAVSPTSNR
jgi:peptidoglycan LD-endopeptidase LytH